MSDEDMGLIAMAAQITGAVERTKKEVLSVMPVNHPGGEEMRNAVMIELRHALERIKEYVRGVAQ
jgi:hypothetical protein